MVQGQPNGIAKQLESLGYELLNRGDHLFCLVHQETNDTYRCLKLYY